MSEVRATLSPLFTWRSAVASKESGLSPTQRHVALTLSLHMSEKGDSCFPSMPTLVDETGLGLSTVRESLRRLGETGWLERVVSHQRGRTNRYRALVPEAYRQERALGEETARSEHSYRQEQASIPPSAGGEVVTESDIEDDSSGDAVASRAPDEIWNLLEETFGAVADKTQAHGRRNKAVGDLRKLGATPDGIRYAMQAWSRQFAGATLTDIALATHYPQLTAGRGETVSVAAAPLPPAAVLRDRASSLERGLKQGVCSECGIGGGRHTTDCSLARETPRRAYEHFIRETAANADYPLEEIGRVIDSWRDLDDVERQHYRELAEEIRNRKTTQEAA